LSGAFTSWLNGNSFKEGLKIGGISAGIGLASGALMGGLTEGIRAVGDGRDFWDGFDYQAALDEAISKEGVNNPNSKWLVANKKNAQLTNEKYKTNIKVSNKRIHFTEDQSSEFGMNIGAKNKGNTTLITKNAIRNRASANLTDIIRHEGTHQLQILAGKTARTFAETSILEYGAYMTNILNPLTEG